MMKCIRIFIPCENKGHRLRTVATTVLLWRLCFWSLKARVKRRPSSFLPICHRTATVEMSKDIHFQMWKFNFFASTKVFEEALNAIKLLFLLKKFGPSQKFLRPVKGCSLCRREPCATKATGFNSTKILKICWCKRWYLPRFVHPLHPCQRILWNKVIFVKWFYSDLSKCFIQIL